MYDWENMADAAPRMRSLAVVIHGRMGGLAPVLPGTPPRAVRSLENAPPSPLSAALCAASLERHVLAPNRARFATIDVIGHSWSPEIGATLDALFVPRRSLHEHGPMRAGFRCPESSFAHMYCHRTFSHVLGISRAMALKRLEEKARGAMYDLVILLRWDILWRTPLLDVRSLPGWHAQRERRRRSVWLPRICAPIRGGDNIGRGFRQAVCGGMSSSWLATQAARECAQAARACDHDMTAEAREIMVMDWWLVLGTSADADEFASGMSDRFAEYGAMVRQRLSSKPRGIIAMGHAWFGAQLLWTMNVTLRHHGNIGVDFHLGRAWDQFDCLAMRPACKSAVCTSRDLVLAPWHGDNARWPVEAEPFNASLPQVTSKPDERSQMASSCEDRYFICRKPSRRCIETEAALEPVDQTNRRALFLGCAEQLCDPGAASNTTECAGRLLSLWINISSTEDRPTRGRPAGELRRGESRAAVVFQSAISTLRARAAAALPPGEGSPWGHLSPVCLDAWQRSRGGAAYPVFRPAAPGQPALYVTKATSTARRPAVSDAAPVPARTASAQGRESSGGRGGASGRGAGAGGRGSGSGGRGGAGGGHGGAAGGRSSTLGGRGGALSGRGGTGGGRGGSSAKSLPVH